jgi:putative phosphoribosyl transferase
MFYDRNDAGRQLGRELSELDLHDPLVLGIPRGGVVVAARIAEELGGELDVALARKLRAPWQRELAVGSISEDGSVYISADADRVPGLTEAYLKQESDHQRAEIERRREQYRNVRPKATVTGRSVIIADDGMATGSTMIAALEALRHEQPRELIAALPVAPATRLHDVKERCDRLVCLNHPTVYYAVGQFYERFDEVTDEQVLELLRQHARGVASGHGL